MGTTKDIREAVEAELEFDPLVDDAVVSAAWMAGGVMQVRDDLDITG
jgi:hypothetical protein